VAIEGTRLAGQVALVTGAGSKDGIGVGAAISIVFAREGALVVIVNRSADAAEATADTIRQEGGKCTVVLADVSIAADCRRAAEKAVAAYGRVDILVNNAAISDPGSIFDVTEENWDAVMNVNLKGMMMMTQALMPHIGRGGSIINISSRSALRPLMGHLAYATSKGAINTLTSAIAMQVASLGVRVNSVVPGGPWTPVAKRILAAKMSDDEVAAVREARRLEVPLKTEGTAWDVANAVLFFASKESSWVTGQSLVVDGGYVLRDPSEAAREACDRGAWA
jgi:NAD(P)-dependent dehydrogenase (short-subunit alcohol dehydrogenase family)